VRRLHVLFASFVLLTAFAVPAHAQGGDVTIFLGTAYPVYDERFTLRASTPALPGIEVTSPRPLELKADGGLAFGAALAFELGVLGIEGRLDVTDVGFDVAGTRYDLLRVVPPLEGARAAVTVSDGRLDADRLYLLSLNARLRTPGPIGLFVSGGLSLLPDINITGSVPVSAEFAGIPVSLDARIRLTAVPGESTRRAGINGGVGLRIGGSRVAVMGEVRVFYFGDYDLRFQAEAAPSIVTDLLDSLEPISFRPVIVNAQAGLVFRF
jgi:hypothetical protein